MAEHLLQCRRERFHSRILLFVTQETLVCSYDVIITGKMTASQSFFLSRGEGGGGGGGRSKSNGPDMANKVEGEQARIYNRELLPWTPVRCGFVHCLGGRGLFDPCLLKNLQKK